MLLTTACSSDQTTPSTADAVKTAKKDAQGRSWAPRCEINLWRTHPAFCILTIQASESSPRTWSRWLNRLLHWQSCHIFLPFYPSAQELFIKIKPDVHFKKPSKNKTTRKQQNHLLLQHFISNKNNISAFSAILPC